MEEVATLIIRVQSDQADAAKKRLRDLGFAAKETETATGGLIAKWRTLTGIMTGVAGFGVAAAGLNKLFETAKKFESLEAQLKTATGSAEQAKFAFEAIQDFATQTPYDLAQTTEAFIKLVNLGLTPSERALRSYGNTSSAMGKDLRAMVQAVANATTGEFEMLKQFGVKARTEADGISFSFRGTTTKVKNDARSIEEYFIKLGEMNFAGAMSERMATLEGKVSNLGDAWDVLFATIAKAGAGDLMKEAIDVAIDAVTELTGLIGSGQLGGYVDALLFKFEHLTDGVYNAFQNISSLLGMVFEYWTTDGKGAVDFIINAFKQLPENVRAVAQLVGAGWGLWIEYAMAAGRGIYDAVSGYFVALIETAKNVGKEVWSHLKPGASDFDFAAAQAATLAKFSNEVGNAWDKTVGRISAATDAYEEQIIAVLDERDANLASFAAKIKSADALREAYERVVAARKKAGEGNDRLEKFRVGGAGVTREFDKLRDDLRSQEKALADSYQKRKQLIIDNTAAESALRAELLSALEERFEDERRTLLDKTGIDLAVKQTAVEDANAVELALLQQGFADKQRALDDAYEARLISQEEFNRRSEQLEQRRVQATTAMTNAHLTEARTKELNNYALVLGMAGDIATMLEGMAHKGSDSAKALFIASKAIAIAQAIVNTEVAATRALAEGGMIMGIPMATAIRALGYASVGVIAAQSIMEARGFKDGGIVPGSSYVGDKVPVRVNSGEMILNQGQQRNLWSLANGGNTGGGSSETNVFVNVDVQGLPAEVETRERETPDGRVIDVIVKRAAAEVAKDIRGQVPGPVRPALQAVGFRMNAA